MIKRALVTGGCGFIGSNLVHRLVDEGWKVTVVDDMSNGHLELLEGLKVRVIPDAGLWEIFRENTIDAIDEETVLVIQDDFAHSQILMSVKRKEYDVIFHQAAVPRVSYSVEHPSDTTDVNISSTIALFESAIESVDRIVWASSSSIYGGADVLPTHESTQKNPKSPYAWQKSAVEDAAALFGELYNLDIVCLRYFNVFGPGQYGDSPYSTAVSAWCNNTKVNKPLRSDGDGTQSRDMCYVDNVVDANILSATADIAGGFMGRCYNIACGDRTSNNEILDHFKDQFPHIVIEHAPWRPGDVMHTQADVTRAREDFGYEPRVRFWEGLKRTIEWWQIGEVDE